MNDAEFFAKVNPKKLSSLDEDFKREQAQFRKDEQERVLKRSGKVKAEPQETTYERFKDSD
jgi:hypothetical protein